MGCIGGAIDSVFLETAMHSDQTHLHYSPSSVGALMDPVFLRGAVVDAEGGRRTECPSAPRMKLDWRAAMHVLFDALRRR